MKSLEDDATNALVGICQRVLAECGPGDLRTAVSEICARLTEPLRLAVAGRVSAGKSTLVNALLGLNIAPTAAGECTRVVTWYRYGDRDKVTAVLRDGTNRTVALRSDRTLPDVLPEPWESVAFLNVELYSSPLRDLTIIDTPGVSGLGEDDGDVRVASILTGRSAEASREADALLYVITREVREDDQKILASFAGADTGLRLSAANTLVVLNKIDKLGQTTEDIAAISGQLIDAARFDLGRDVETVIATIGLLAETSMCGLLDESKARLLRHVGTLSEAQQAVLIRGRRSGLGTESTDVMSQANWLDLLRLLDVYGARNCIRSVQDGRGGANALVDICRRLSGIDDLRATLFQTFRRRADVLKADSAITSLRGLLASAGPVERRILTRALNEGAEVLALLPAGDDLRIIALFREMSAGRISLPRERQDDLRRWITSNTLPGRVGLDVGTPEGQVNGAAMMLASKWRAYGNDPARDSEQRLAADTMTAALARALQPGAP